MVAVEHRRILLHSFPAANEVLARISGRRPPAAEVDNQWLQYSEGARPAKAQISGFSTDATNDSGITKFVWKGPGDPINFRMKVDVEKGDAESIIAQVWTNSDRNGDPENFYAVDMKGRKVGNQVEFEASLPIHNVGNYKAIGRISTDGGRSWKWMDGDFGLPALKYRVKYAEHETINEHIVNVQMANVAPGEQRWSTFADLSEGRYGDYNLEAIKDAGFNAVRIQPPFRADLWDKHWMYDTEWSPYAATDYFAIDPRASRDCQKLGLTETHWDRDQAMKVANAEFKRFVDKAHKLGLQVILDIAVNHTGHNFTFRDYFENAAEGERVMRNNYSQIAVNDQQLGVIERRLHELGGDGPAELVNPQMFAAKDKNPEGAPFVYDMLEGGNGEWTDTKQLFHGAYNWGGVEIDSDQSRKVCDWMGRVLQFWANEMGVDGFRLDHSSNLPTRFWEDTMNRFQSRAKKPIAIVGEDFNQNNKLRPYLDALESGWYRDMIGAFKGLSVEGILGIIDHDYFTEIHRTGNHDETRIIEQFGGDMQAATRYQCTMKLLGGWYASVYGDEYLEGHKAEFKKRGQVPPVLHAARLRTLPAANIEAKRWIQQAGHMKSNIDALKTAWHERLQPAQGGFNDILPVSRHAYEGDQTALVFTNLSNSGARSQRFQLDDVTRGKIDPNASYQVKDLMGNDWGKGQLWAQARKGQELLDDGIFVKLEPYQIQALLLEKVG